MKTDPVAIAGIGHSAFARSLDEGAGDLAVAAGRAAIAYKTNKWKRGTRHEHLSDELWGNLPLPPPDVDVAGLYDGSSFLELCWLEDAGFCAKGEGGPFAASDRSKARRSASSATAGGRSPARS